MDAVGWLLAGFIAPLLRLVVLTPILWLVRLFAPSWERVLFQKIG